jgi:hypothetical protein
VRLTDGNGQTLRDEKGEKIRWKKRLPPAMEIGLTDTFWTPDDLLSLTDAFVAARREKGRQEKRDAKAAARAALKKSKIDALGERRAPYWVYRSHVHHTTKVHMSECSACNDGHGKQRKGNNKSGEWFPFQCVEDAEGWAKAARPYDHSVCNVCLGEYRKLGRRI